MLALESRRKYIGIALLPLLMLTLVPISMSYAQTPATSEKHDERAEKFVAMVEQAGEKVGDFINLIYANQTAIDAITKAGLKAELDANQTQFNYANNTLLNNARTALTAGDFSGAIANATQALGIFRDVFKAINAILVDSKVQRGQLIEAQGLIEAMERAMDRIQKLRKYTSDPSILALLDEAESNVTATRELLSQGKVNEAVQDLKQANQLISQAYLAIVKKAEELYAKRIEAYIKIVENFYNATKKMVDKAVDKKLPGAEQLQAEFPPVKALIDEAKILLAGKEYSKCIVKLTQASVALRGIERDLLRPVLKDLQNLKRKLP
jgi:tetratricopeptide (TPR) repeat protein